MNDLLPLLRSTAQLRSRLRSWRAFGETVALAPVGPAMHEGHLALIRAARAEGDRALAVVLLAPDAPAPDAERLCQLADEAGADALHLPPPEALRPPGAVTQIRLPGMTDVLCGEEAPEVLADFALVMTRLFNQSQADAVLFGERDWQSLAIMRRLAADLGLATRVLPASTERDTDGLAYATGTGSLSEADRRVALRLFRELSRAAAALDQGADPDETLDAAADALADAGAEVEYLELRDADTLAELDAPEPGRPARVFAAIHIGGLRLIDNVPVGEPSAL